MNSCNPSIEQSDRVFQAQWQADAPSVPAPAHQTLLQSFLQAGHEPVSSCRNGTCRACLRQLSQGHVHYRIDWPGLSAEEKAQGWLLPCVAYPDSDLILRDAA